MHRSSVNFEYAAVTDLTYLVRVQQLHLACALINVIPKGDAVMPALDSPFALCPEIYVNRVTGHEHPAKGADVFCLFFRGNMADSSCKRLRPIRRRCQKPKKVINYCKKVELLQLIKMIIVNLQHQLIHLRFSSSLNNKKVLTVWLDLHPM